MTSFYIETYGCSHNFADSERMAGLLKAAQFEPVDNLEDAHIVIFNTCTLKGRAADFFFTKLEQVREENPYKVILVGGCIAQTERKRLQDYSLIGAKSLHHIVEVVEESLNDNIVKMLETGEIPPLNLPRIRKNPIIEIIPISVGCLNDCSFCKTKAARGHLKSYRIEEIVDLARNSLKEGVKEFWLTSQDTMCYGFDIQTNLARLLMEIIKIPGEFKVRVGMGNPEHLLKFKDELIQLFNHPKIFKFIHLPLQSGSDRILKDMNRNNTVKEFVDLIKQIREIVPNITIATDIIAGFPTETEEDFWETLSIARIITPDVMNISRFWPRPKTPAADLEQLPVEEIERRKKVLTDIFHNISTLQNERWCGWQGEIIIDEKGQEEKQWVGRNPAYKPVLVEGEFKLGDIVNVKINKTGRFDLRGEVVKTKVKVYHD